MKRALSTILSFLGVIPTSYANLPQPIDPQRISFSEEQLYAADVDPLVFQDFMSQWGWELTHDEEGILDFECFDCIVNELPADVLQMASFNELQPK